MLPGHNPILTVQTELDRKSFNELRSHRIASDNAAISYSLSFFSGKLIGVNYSFRWTTSISPYRIDSPYLLLSDGSLPHRKCYPM
jgi:hypothetical protein